MISFHADYFPFHLVEAPDFDLLTSQRYRTNNNENDIFPDTSSHHILSFASGTQSYSQTVSYLLKVLVGQRLAKGSLSVLICCLCTAAKMWGK